MLPASKRIAILHHHNETEGGIRKYVIGHLAAFWREDGHEVVHLFGCDRYVAADVLVVHVDLSVVPDAYLEFARRYELALNGRVRDIRKSVLSQLTLRRGDRYAGRVIVKSDLNCYGLPEARLLGSTAASLIAHARPWLARSLGRPAYRIYQNLEQVPAAVFDRDDVVVERFVPEMDGELYCVRSMQFFGDRTMCVRVRSRDPIVKAESYDELTPVEPHPDMLAARERLGFDFGKFDYVEVDGKAILLDANKTVGGGRMAKDPTLIALRRFRAEGLYSYL